jgi:DHA1 family bicyclomycin/chloramphenicol resistance-like MFS transporter
LASQLNKVSGAGLKPKQRLVYIIVLGFLLMVQTLITDMFLPAFPSIANFFRVPDAYVQYSLSALTLGAAVGFFVAGPLSDSLGRKRPTLVALALFSLASFLLYLAPNIEVFVLLRFVQGLTAAGAAVIAQAIIRDLFVGDAMIRMLGRVWLISGIAPIVSPLIASQLLLIGDWRSIALALGLLGTAILLVASRALVETLHLDNRRAKGFEGVNRRFIAVFRDRIILGLVLIGMAQTLAAFSYLNNLPFLYQDSFGLTPVQFSGLFSISAASWFIGIQIGAVIGRIYKPQWVIFGGLLLAVFSGVGLYFAGVTASPLWVVVGLVSVFIFTFGLSITPIQTIALQGHGSEAGTAASVLGVVNSFTAAIGAPLYPLVGSESSANMGIAIILSHLVALVLFFAVLRPKSIPELIKEQ